MLQEEPLKASWAAKYTDSKRPMDTTIRRAAMIFKTIPAMKLCLGPQHWARTVTEATIKRIAPTKPGYPPAITMMIAAILAQMTCPIFQQCAVLAAGENQSGLLHMMLFSR